MIIKKLGITSGSWHICSVGKDAEKVGVGVPYNLICTVNSFMNQDDKKANIPDATLIAAAPEMLEALIEIRYALEQQKTKGKPSRYAMIVTSARGSVNAAIVHATGKTWEKIKELLR